MDGDPALDAIKIGGGPVQPAHGLTQLGHIAAAGIQSDLELHPRRFDLGEGPSRSSPMTTVRSAEVAPAWRTEAG